MKKVWKLLALLLALMIETAAAATLTVSGTATGVSGEVKVTLTVTDRVITAMEVDHNDTPGIADAAAEMLPERIVESNSLNVDVIAGVTVTSKAILAAAKNALLAAGLDPNDYMDEVEAEPEEPTEPDDDDPVDMPEGAVTGTATGMMGKVTVGLMLNNRRITAVYVDHDDSLGIGSAAAEMLPERIVESNSLNVDVVAGATVTSKAILEAAKNALLAAGLDPNDYMDEVEAEPEEPTDPDDDEPVDMPEGVVTGTATGMMGKVTVGLMLNNRRITAVYVDHDDSLGIGSVAAEMLSERIVESNSLNVDVVAGATVTSKAILAATKNALLAAGLDPNDYMGKDDSATEAGDPDEDGRITVKDAIAVLKYCMGENVSINLDAADVTGDGKVDENDVLRILQYQAGWNVMLN